METLGPETDSICSSDIAALGLKDCGKGNLENPRVLSILATLLEKCVHKNERLLESAPTKEATTIFHGSRAPSLSIQRYIDRISKYSCCSPSCFVVAHIYMDTFIQRTDLFFLTSLNIHRLLITSVMVAAKFMDDSFFNNAYYARVGGVSTSEMNRLEMKFLFCLDFRLYVSVQTFSKYCSVYKREASGGLIIERSIQACGAEESWTNKDDSTRARSVAR
ncbi:hypothetical protein OROHE_025841 [Orobanche hederae]